MLYIKHIILVLILSVYGCSTQPYQHDLSSQNPSGKTTANSSGKPTFNKTERSFYKQALTALYNNELNKAESILKKFYVNRPDLAGPLANLGLVYYKKNNYPEAKNILHKALKLNPKLAEALNLSGMIELKEGNIQKAHELYIKAIKYKDSYANAHHNLALLNDIYLQDIEQAIFHYKRYLQFSKTKDKITIQWLEQLENSIKDE